MSNTKGALILAAISLCLVTGLCSCGDATSGTLTPYLPDAETDSILVLVELRVISTIEFDLDVATRRQAAAVASEVSARISPNKSKSCGNFSISRNGLLLCETGRTLSTKATERV